MSDINQIITLPNIDSPEYKEIFFNIATQCHSVTRAQKGTIACKSSQLIYIIIALIWQDRVNNIKKAEKVSKIYDKCARNSAIYKFSILNNPSSIQPFIVIENENISAIFSPRNHIKIFTMGLVNIGNNNKDEYPDGVIDHYFIIVNRGRDYFIISSYGSDYVKMPQTEIPLELTDLYSIINAFNNSEFPDRISIITNFFNKYFLSNGETKYLKDEDSFSRPKMITYAPEEGAKLEVEHYFTPNKFKIYYFPTFINVINDLIEGMTFEGGNNKYSKSRRRKNKKTRKTRNKRSRKTINKRSRKNTY